VAQPLPLDSQLGLFVGIGRDFLDLGELVAIEIQIALARTIALAKLRQLRFEPQALAMGLAVFLAQLEVTDTGKAVEHVHLS